MRYLSWLLVACGVLLIGYGAYDFYTAQMAQRLAAKEWASSPQMSQTPSGQASGTDTEQPVPEETPRGIRPYFDPYRPGETVAKLKLPGLNRPLYVVEGTNQTELRKGPGHMPGTALPGVQGNCVIAGHRDTHFRALKGIHKGDHIELDTQYGTFHYQVQSTEIVSPTNVNSLYPTKTGILHLVTCYPFEYIGHAPKRIIVAAVLLPNAQTPSIRTGE
jgi:sortase A